MTTNGFDRLLLSSLRNHLRQTHKYNANFFFHLFRLRWGVGVSDVAPPLSPQDNE